MSETIIAGGTTYSGVEGIKATDSNDVVQTFIKPTGTKSITANGTGIDVAQYAAVDVSVGGITLENVLNKNVTGNITLNVTEQPTPTSDANGSKYFGTAFSSLFMDMTEVTSITISGLKWVPPQIARQNTGVTAISFPDAIFAGARACQGATNLVSASFPSLEKGYANYSDLSQYMFSGCTKLTTVDVDDLDRIGTSMFNGCTALTVLDFNAINYINGTAFSGCTNLATLVIRSSSVPTLSNINAFQNTPFASGKAGGTLYVPSSLISSYQSAGNWSTILGYSTNSIAAIEGSIYE